MKTLILAALFAFGCSGPPSTLTIDPKFGPAGTAVIKDAISQWCAADNYCPTVTAKAAEGRIELVLTPKPEPGEQTEGGLTYYAEGVSTIFSGSFASRPAMLWILVAHELGHLQGFDDDYTPGHEDCTMYYKQDEVRSKLACE